MPASKSGVKNATLFTVLDHKTFPLLAQKHFVEPCVIKCSLAEWQIGFVLSATFDQLVGMSCS